MNESIVKYIEKHNAKKATKCSTKGKGRRK